MRNKQRGQIGGLDLLIIFAIIGIFLALLIPATNDLKFLRNQGLEAEKIQSEINICETTLPRTKKCVVKYQVVPE